MAASACATTPAPLGEALIVVRTDVAIPNRVARLRIDIHDRDDKLVESREVVTPTAADWPVSFSVITPDDTEQDFHVRLRAYPEGHLLSARELERFARQSTRTVTVASSIDELCQDPPELRLGEALTLRRGSFPITTVLPSINNGVTDCTEPTLGGSVAAKLVIAGAGEYEIEVERSVPDGSRDEPGGDTTLSLRTDCRFPTTQMICADDIDKTNKLSRLTLRLEPGTYFVVTGTRVATPADLTLLALPSKAILQVPTPTPEPPSTAAAGALEPEPGVTIDRLLDVHLVPGERGNVEVTLRGECFGTTPNLAEKTTCIDTAGQRRPVPTETPRAPLVRPTTMAPPSWAGDQPIPCTIPVGPNEICVPGGAFVLGDMLALEDLDRRAQPERMRVVPPFIIDKYEMTVARYRDAVRRGFQSPDDTPKDNGELVLSSVKERGACTWNKNLNNDPAEGINRESYPLNCVSWTTARAVCQFYGGDLPTEDQWELAATVGKDRVEYPYPWGRELPTCDRTVYARGVSPQEDACTKAGRPVGPAPVTELEDRDVSPLGIVGLGGNVQEWLVNGFTSYADAAWERAGLRGPIDAPETPLRAVRGGDWLGFPLYATGSARRAQPPVGNYTTVGFRCARPGR